MTQGCIRVDRIPHFLQEHGCHICHAFRVLDNIDDVLKVLVCPLRVPKTEGAEKCPRFDRVDIRREKEITDIHSSEILADLSGDYINPHCSDGLSTSCNGAAKFHH